MMALLLPKHPKVAKAQGLKPMHLDLSLGIKTIPKKLAEIEEHRVTITLSIFTRKTTFALGLSSLILNIYKLSTLRACNQGQERLIMIK